MTETATAAQKSNNSTSFNQNPTDKQSPASSGRWQNLIATNTAIAIGSRIHGTKAEIYVNGMAVQLAGKSIGYPSVVVVGGEPKFSNAGEDVLVNPTVVVEIIGGDNNPADRAQKLECYLAIPSIKECFLIRTDEMRVEHYARQNAKQWLYRIYDERDDVVSLDSVNCKLSVAEIYAQIKVKEASMSSRAVH